MLDLGSQLQPLSCADILIMGGHWFGESKQISLTTKQWIKELFFKYIIRKMNETERIHVIVPRLGTLELKMSLDRILERYCVLLSMMYSTQRSKRRLIS